MFDGADHIHPFISAGATLEIFDKMGLLDNIVADEGHDVKTQSVQKIVDLLSKSTQ